jgi:hypothetical protein
VVLEITHLGDDAAVGHSLGVRRCPLANELQQVPLQREDEFGEQAVVSFLVATRWKTTVYRHQRTIIITILSNRIAYREKGYILVR